MMLIKETCNSSELFQKFVHSWEWIEIFYVVRCQNHVENFVHEERCVKTCKPTISVKKCSAKPQWCCLPLSHLILQYLFKHLTNISYTFLIHHLTYDQAFCQPVIALLTCLSIVRTTIHRETDFVRSWVGKNAYENNDTKFWKSSGLHFREMNLGAYILFLYIKIIIA